MAKKDTTALGVMTVNFSKEITNAPYISEDNLKKAAWVYFDSDNLYPQRLIRLADNSPLHGAAVRKHAMFIAGDGLQFKTDNEAEKDRAIEYLESVVGDLNGFVSSLAIDESYFNGHCAAMQFARGGDLLKSKHMDFSMIRTGKELEMDMPTNFWYSTDWKLATGRRSWQGRYLQTKPVEYPNYDTSEAKSGVMFIYSRRYKPSKLYYPEPEYIGAIKYIETEIRLSQYVDNLTQKGFRAGTHIHLYKEMDDATAKKTEDAINDKFTSETAPDIILTYGGDPAAAPNMNQMPAFTNAEILTTVGAELDKKIDSAHPIPSMLYTSWKTESGLDGQSKALKETIEYYQNSAVRPHQRAIAQTLQKILSHGGIETPVSIKPANPINFILDKDIMLKSLTVNEIREEMGWEPFEDGDKRGQIIPDITEHRDGLQQQDDINNND